MEISKELENLLYVLHDFNIDKDTALTIAELVGDNNAGAMELSHFIQKQYPTKKRIVQKAFEIFVTATTNKIPRTIKLFDDGLYYDYVPQTNSIELAHQKHECTGDIVIPASVEYAGKELKVDEVPDSTFHSCESLQSVHIADGITKIDHHAFALCSGLTSIRLPETLKTIESYAFYGCTSLTEITIPQSVEFIDPAAFYMCHELRIRVDENNPIYDSRENCNAIIETATNTLYAANKYTTIPKTVTNIGWHAYHNCQGIKDMIIPEGIKNIGFMAFSGDQSSIRSITIPESVVEIQSSFCYNKNLKSIVWNAINCHSTIFDMGKHSCTAFVDSGVTSFVFGTKVEHIPSLLFKDMDKLKSLIIPPSVKTIADDAFTYCRKLTHVQIPQHLHARAKDIFGTQTGIRVYTKEEGDKMFS